MNFAVGLQKYLHCTNIKQRKTFRTPWVRPKKKHIKQLVQVITACIVSRCKIIDMKLKRSVGGENTEKKLMIYAKHKLEGEH